ncbi:type I restriction enzyme HsdR N-terminal domain-containing protein [Pontibacter sp. Tf4]|uniref:type I restriction endonuclease n=1 Tax=Pontibacter sp. Tf4 TaxID=2761620 RepID=UPI001623D7AB|nr:type I restriction endonuclease [Pontibacter sp. Tf4]MBB6612171.1 type I restriction enzyme HsdR N-terminal domain-containing protein [Pontibacter sp. Tf4]
MDFIDIIKALSEKVGRLQNSIQTEEATKNAFIMPFIAALGYDVFNPHEVVPEFIADLGIKKGEKVDYCIFKDEKPVIIIECKHWKEDLNVHNSQLHRYFHVTTSKFGILTNGITYKFYTDLIEPNKMDDKPFWEFNITEITDVTVAELKKYHKNSFDIDKILNAATELKYNREIKKIMLEEMNNPTDAFVRHFAKQIHSGVLTAKVMEQFTGIVKKALNQYVSDLISDRLKSALQNEAQRDFADTVSPTPEKDALLPEETTENKVVTTELEKEAFYIVRSILITQLDVNRIVYRDAQSYFSVLVDDNNRKPVCRLFLEGIKKSIVLFDENRKETRHELTSLDDIYLHTEQLIVTATGYDIKKATS